MRGRIVLGLVLGVVSLMVFQNCGPAKVTGTFQTGNTEQASVVAIPNSQQPPVAGASPGPSPTPTPVALPDLEPVSISFKPENPVNGDYVVFSVVVRNKGPLATAAGVVVRLLCLVDGEATTWSNNYSDSLPAGGFAVLTVNDSPVLVPGYRAKFGVHSVICKVNDMNQIRESNSDNNQIATTVFVQ